jgi:peroxiredoxin Q/BCP
VVESLRAFDTEPFGINPDDADSHQAFIEALGIDFDLLVDEERRVAAEYGALKPDGSGIARTVVIVDKTGNVLFTAPGAPPPSEMLAVIRTAKDNGA